MKELDEMELREVDGGVEVNALPVLLSNAWCFFFYWPDGSYAIGECYA